MLNLQESEAARSKDVVKRSIKDAATSKVAQLDHGGVDPSHFSGAYREAHRLLGGFSSDVEEVGVSISTADEHDTDSDGKLSDTMEDSLESVDGDMVDMTNDDLRRMIRSEFFRQYETQLRRIETQLQAVGIDLSKEIESLSQEGRGRSESVLFELESELEPEETAMGAAVEDDIGISVPEKYKNLGRLFGNRAEASLDDKLSEEEEEEEESSSGPGAQATARDEEECEVGVASSWYSISDHPVDAARIGDGDVATGNRGDLLLCSYNL